MAVGSEGEATDIRNEWRGVFEKLPAEEQPENLRDELKPKWRWLNKRCTAAAPVETDLGGASSALENPPVNPLTYAGRTATEVAREVHGHRQYTRRTNPNPATPPVYLGDSLFVQLPSKPLFFARITGNAYIDEACNERITVQVGEYTHDPQPRVPGYFGMFTKTANLNHDPADKRTGGKFVRHANITRDEIVLYAVTTWVDRGALAQNAADEVEVVDCIRVAASSLPGT